MAKTKITREMTIAEILGKFAFKAEKLAQMLTRAGLNCVGCGAASYETLEGGMESHGKTQEQIEKLLNELNTLVDEPVDLSQVTLTKRAAQKFQEIAALEGKPNAALRFDEELAGCSGYEYVLDFSEGATNDDAIYTSHGLEIHVKRAKLPRLQGCEVDYMDGLHSSGFKISNPNAKSACGCGTSHGY